MKFLALACLVALIDGAAAVRSPVEKVVELLTSLKEDIEQDEKSETMMYNKVACWCKKASSAKAEAIERAQQELRVVGQNILSLQGKVATLKSEIEKLEVGIKDNIAAQAKATSIRQKENGLYMSETSEMKQALKALEQGIKILIAATKPGTSLLQSKAQTVAAVRVILQSLPSTTSLSPSKISMLSEFTSDKYTPQSLSVQGILTDMYSTFSSDLESATHGEAQENHDYEALIAVKESELKNLQKIKAEKEFEKADAESMLADRSQTYDDTKGTMEGDISFFDQTKASCEAKADEWSVRSAMRAEELKGINEAISILTSDDARAMFSTAIKPGKETGTSDKFDTGVDIAGFLQIGAHVSGAEDTPASRAYSVLKAQSSKAKSLRLASLAVQVRMAKAGHFDEVLKAIDEMIATLKEEGKADIAKRDECKAEYTKINSTIENVDWLIEKNQAKIDKLENLIEARTKEKTETVEEIATVTQQIKDMETNRIAENQAFINSKKEDVAAIGLLVQARTALSSYYANHSIEMGPVQGNVKDVLMQQPEFAISNETMPEVTFTGKDEHAGKSKGIISILTMIIEDLNDEIKNGMKTEEMTQVEFEKNLNSAKSLKSALEGKKTNLESIIAKRKEELTTQHQDKESNENDKEDEINYRKSITPDCDFIIGAFSSRAGKRTAEINGLTSAKEFLVGAGGNAESLLMQGKAKRKFDDMKLSRIGFLGLAK